MLLQSTKWKWFGLLLGIIMFFITMVGSIVLGYTSTSLKTALDAIVEFNGSNEHLVIQTLRIPRALIGATVGASLAIAGLFMQSLTRNPLASPSIFGVNAGAGFFIVAAVSFFSLNSIMHYTWIAFGGASFAALVVYALGSFGREGLTPMRLTLAGAAIAALFSSFTQGMLVLNEKALDEVLFWLAGSVQGRKLDVLLPVLPYFVIAWIIALLLSFQLNLLNMGEDVAKGLGQRTWLVKVIAAIVIIILAGGSVAVAGPIGFIGIVVPHLSRAIVGYDYRWLVPYCALLGSVLLMLADIGARYVIMPQEVPVGVMTAIIGTPFFIYIARKGMSNR